MHMSAFNILSVACAARVSGEKARAVTLLMQAVDAYRNEGNRPMYEAVLAKAREVELELREARNREA